ncbi:MAG: putative prokaryotic signal transducing protein [Acidimicrobiaceae bacterium]
MGPMVKLLTFGDGFEAKVVRARLTADGILCELRGGIDSVYPVGPVHLYVLEEDLELAQDLLAAAPEPASED